MKKNKGLTPQTLYLYPSRPFELPEFYDSAPFSPLKTTH